MAAPVLNVEPGTRTLTSYRDVSEAFRSPVLQAKPDPSDPFAAATVRWIHGQQHVIRRRALSRLLMRGGDRWFREHILFPTTANNLARILALPDADGYASADLVDFAHRVFLQQAAGIAGFRDHEGGETTRELDELASRIRAARRVFNSGRKSDVLNIAPDTVMDESEIRELLDGGLAAKRDILERFFRPALREHRALIAKVEAGEMEADLLPRDFLTVIALSADPAWADEDLALREVITDTLSAGVDTSAQLLCNVMDEMLAWLDADPERRSRCASADFVRSAINETLRLHPLSSGFIRTAVEDVVLASGVRIEMGERVVLDQRSANRDPEFFGPDPERFDPDRTAPDGILPYGVSFGAGPHMCYGQPLVLGSQEAEGTHLHIVMRLFDAGIERDPLRSPATHPHSLIRLFTSYPVRVKAQ